VTPMPWPPSSSASSTSPRSSTGSTSCPTNSQVRARRAQLQELHQFPNIRPAGSTLSGVDAATDTNWQPGAGMVWSTHCVAKVSPTRSSSRLVGGTGPDRTCPRPDARSDHLPHP
jgi:hypothetical protein